MCDVIVVWPPFTWVVLQYSPMMTRANGSDNPDASDPIKDRAWYMWARTWKNWKKENNFNFFEKKLSSNLIEINNVGRKWKEISPESHFRGFQEYKSIIFFLSWVECNARTKVKVALPLPIYPSVYFSVVRFQSTVKTAQCDHGYYTQPLTMIILKKVL